MLTLVQGKEIRHNIKRLLYMINILCVDILGPLTSSLITVYMPMQLYLLIVDVTSSQEGSYIGEKEMKTSFQQFESEVTQKCTLNTLL